MLGFNISFSHDKIYVSTFGEIPKEPIIITKQ